MIINPERTDTLIDALSALWEASVRATHHFLTEDDIQKLVPFVRKGLSGIGTLVVAEDNHVPVAFMGIDAGKIEMLFVSPGSFGKGIGRELADFGVSQYGVRYVDVNEQNPQAAGFYRHIGFEVFERNELDEQGNPFPILKMKLHRKENTMNIISVREQPQYAQRIIAYLQQCWSEVEPIIYSDCVNHCIDAANPLPQWYVLMKEDEIIGCAGLITNDFISRMDLYPWLCALFIDENHRGNGYGQLLIEKTKEDARKSGFANLYLCTDLVGYYEKYGFCHLGEGYHPWGETSRIYGIAW